MTDKDKIIESKEVKLASFAKLCVDFNLGTWLHYETFLAIHLLVQAKDMAGLSLIISFKFQLRILNIKCIEKKTIGHFEIALIN